MKGSNLLKFPVQRSLVHGQVREVTTLRERFSFKYFLSFDKFSKRY